MLHFHPSIISFYLPEVPGAGNGKEDMKRFDTQKSFETKNDEKETILKSSQEGTRKILQEYINQNPERAKQYETLSKSLTEAEGKKDMGDLGKLRAQKLQFEQYALIEGGILQNENMKKDVKEVLKNRNGYESLRTSDILLLRKKGIDIAPLLLYDPARPDSSITSDSLKAGQTLTVNFGSHKGINHHIGIGDILPPRIGKVEILGGKEGARIGTWKPLPQPGYYTESGKYISVYDGYTVRVIDDAKTYTQEEEKRNSTMMDARLTSARAYDMIDAGYLSPDESGKRPTEADMERGFSSLPEDKEVYNTLSTYSNSEFPESEKFFNPKNRDAFVAKYKETVNRECQHYDIPPGLLLRLIQRESGFNHTIKNTKSSAHGFGQIIDSTWRSINKKIGGLDRNNPQDQIKATCFYLHEMRDATKTKDYADAFVLYHTGPGIYNTGPSYIRSLKRVNAPIANMMGKYGLPDTAEGYMAGAAYFYGVNEFRGQGYSQLEK